MNNPLPNLSNTDWHETHKIWHDYLRVIGKIRAQCSIKQKHWWHVALNPSLNGLTTGIMEYEGVYFEIEVDLQQSNILLLYRDSDPDIIALRGQSSRDLFSAINSLLSQKKIKLTLADDVLSDTDSKKFALEESKRLANALHFTSQAFSVVRNEQRQETGPVVLWPHHFDLAFLWFSGRLIPDTDPADEEHSDEQMNIGFSFGDTTITEPYFYISAYPWQDSFTNDALPEGVYWHHEGFNAAIMTWSVLETKKNPKEFLIKFCRHVLDIGKQLMLE